MAIHERGPKHCVFVYGTLKKGQCNHALLAGFKGIAARAAGIVLHAGPAYPFAVRGAGTAIGEVYAVDNQTLAKLDALEDHPNDYVRELTPVHLEDGETVHAWIYLNQAGLRYPPIASGLWRRAGFPLLLQEKLADSKGK